MLPMAVLLVLLEDGDIIMVLERVEWNWGFQLESESNDGGGDLHRLQTVAVLFYFLPPKRWTQTSSETSSDHHPLHI